jgi:hypothetical protein
MGMHRFALVAAVALAGCETISRDDLAELNYGTRPAQFRKTVTEYLHPKVPDDKVVQISFASEPKTYVQRETLLRDRHWGWAVCVHVFENHPEGAEEPYPVVFFFRGENMVFVNGGPGDKNPIGTGYARNQCADLGAPPIRIKP